MADRTVEPHEPNEVSEVSFVALSLILFAHGGTITVTKDQLDKFMQLTGHHMVQRFHNEDGSMTFVMEDCPLHNCKHDHTGH